MIPVIINTPFLSLNPKKLCLALRLGQARRQYQLDSSQMKLQLEEDKEPRSCPDVVARSGPQSPQRTEETRRGAQKLADVAGRRRNPCNC